MRTITERTTHAPAPALVYLDSSHLIALDRLRESPGQQDRFFSLWEKAGCDLTITMLHIQEVIAAGDDDTIKRRLDLLERFPRLRGNLRLGWEEPLLEVEFRHEMFAMATRASVFMSDAEFYGLLRDHLFPPVAFGEIRDLFQHHRHFFVQRAEHVARATDLGRKGEDKEREQSKIGRKRRLEAHRAVRWEDAVREITDLVDSAIPQADGYFKQYLIQKLLRAEEVRRKDIPNRQQGLQLSSLENYRSIAGRPEEERPQEDFPILSAASFALHQAWLPRLVAEHREVAEMVVGRFDAGLMLAYIDQRGPDAALRLVLDHVIHAHFDFYRLPGLALRMAVERQRVAVSQPSASNTWHDCSHIMFAPYVDLLFADETTFNFLKAQVSKRRATIPIGAEDAVVWEPEPIAAAEALHASASTPSNSE